MTHTIITGRRSALQGLLCALLCLLSMRATGQTVETLRDAPSGDDMQLYNNHIYSSNYGGDSIRKISLEGTAEEIVKGYTQLGSIEIGSDGTIYVTNWDQGLLLRINNEMQLDTLVQGLQGPSGLAKDSKGNLFINQNAGSKITRFNPENGTMAPLYAGQPLFWNTAITIDDNDNVYSNNMWTGEIIRVTPGGELTVIAELPAIMDNQPDLGYMEWVDGQLMVLHQNNDVVYSVDPATGVYAVVAGVEGTEGHSDGTLLQATFDDPIGIVFNSDRNELYVTDGKEGDHRLRVVKLAAGNKHLPDFSKNPFVFGKMEKPDESRVDIHFDAAREMSLTIRVMNGLYENVESSDTTFAPGSHVKRLDISGYDAGVYFVNLKANGFAKTIKFQKG